MKSNAGILDGVRVLEISHAIAGPTTAQVLCDYGAEVVKIERPGGGDIFRNTSGMGPSMFLAVNRGKKSVMLDLKNPVGLRLFYELVKVSDVIVENMGPGVAQKLGVSFNKIRRTNSKAIYCRIESFGKGPYEKIPAFDPVLQASVGIMSTTGFPPKKYARAGISVVDMATGLHAVSGILALLYRRMITGKGGELSVSLYDAASYFMSYWITLFDLKGKDTSPLGAAHIFGAPYNLFRTRDGFVYIAVANDKAWTSFCESLGFHELLKVKEYATNRGRVAHKKSLERTISKRFRRVNSGSIMKRLKDSEVPCSKLNTVKSLLEDPHFLGSGNLWKYTYSQRNFRTVVNPARVDGARRFSKNSPPELGANTRSVLEELLGLKDSALDKLKRASVISY